MTKLKSFALGALLAAPAAALAVPTCTQLGVQFVTDPFVSELTAAVIATPSPRCGRR